MINNFGDCLKLSLLMAVYNGAHQVAGSLESLEHALPADSEVIVIDDGSTDGTKERLASLQAPWLRVHTQSNQGLTRSLNTALALSNAEFIARLDCGDFCHPDRLKKQLDFLHRHSEIALVGCGVRRCDTSGSALGDSLVVTKPAELKRGLLKINLFQHSSIVVRREAILQVGGYREFFACSQDLDLLLRLSEHFDLSNIPETLSDWVLDPRSISFRRAPEQAAYADIARRCARARRKGLPDPVQSGALARPKRERLSEEAAFARYHLEVARSLLMGGRCEQARSALAEAREYGSKWKSQIGLLAMSVAPPFLRSMMRRLRVKMLLR
jgi:glycosyltransferase involved in cell wall biosynthesis